MGQLQRSGVSRTLKQKISLARGPVSAVYGRLWSAPNVADLFPQHLVRIYDIARASIPLMQAAAQRCEAMSNTDVVAAGMIDYLRNHIEEERDHDVWMLDDLEALGFSREVVLARTPSPTAASLVGAQYYWIHHAHPVALLGYMAALEGDIAQSDFLERVINDTGLNPDGFRTLLLHAREDPGHEADLDRLLDSLPLDDSHISTLGISAMQTVALLGSLTEEIFNRSLGVGSGSE